MTRILTAEELNEYHSEMIIKAMSDWRSFDGDSKTDKESRRAFMNGIIQALHTLRSALKTDILDTLREEVDKLKELAGI